MDENSVLGKLIWAYLLDGYHSARSVIVTSPLNKGRSIHYVSSSILDTFRNV